MSVPRYKMRYDAMSDCHCDVIEHEAGGYVDAGDYDALAAKYHELLYAVASKYPGESRHDTALRYIKDRETLPLTTASTSDKSPPCLHLREENSTDILGNPTVTCADCGILILGKKTADQPTEVVE